MNNISAAIRGATTIEENNELQIRQATEELLKKMLTENSLTSEECVSLIISTTSDITAFYPAAAVRESGFDTVPLFSCSEPAINNSLKLCIRFLLTVNIAENRKKLIKHIYLHEAKSLRKDLTTIGENK